MPIFTEDWGADEELLLLEGAELYGLGSWADIADHIGGYRTKDEVRDHYLQTYIESSRFPLPERASPNDNTLLESVTREDFQAKKKRRIEERKNATTAATTAMTSTPAATPKPKPTASVPSCHEIQGYMPGRLEFETEYANDAEEAVQNMQFDTGDGVNPRTKEVDFDMELKLTVMEIYNSRLTARAERKKVMFEHNLLDYKKNVALDKKRTKEERELLNKCKPFARMMTRADYEEFCLGLLYEHNLRVAIAQLQEWRRMGITDLQGGERYEIEKQQRLQRVQSSSNSSLNPVDRLASSRSSKATPPVETAGAMAAAATGPAAALTSTELTYRPRGIFPATSHDNQASPRLTNGHLSPPNPRAMMQPLGNIQPLKVDLNMPTDWHLLTTEEQQICTSLRLYPKPYLIIKEQALKEALKQMGPLKKKAVKDLCRLDPIKAYRLFDFFADNGWIGRA